MPTNKDLVVYSQKDMLVIGNLINSLEFKGVEAARKDSNNRDIAGGRAAAGGLS